MFFRLPFRGFISLTRKATGLIVFARLPENYRMVLMLGEFAGLKNEQIAEILELTIDTVKIRLHRGRERLKAELSANCGPEWVEGNEFLPELK